MQMAHHQSSPLIEFRLGPLYCRQCRDKIALKKLYTIQHDDTCQVIKLKSYKIIKFYIGTLMGIFRGGGGVLGPTGVFQSVRA